jgi:hypothetical protein
VQLLTSQFSGSDVIDLSILHLAGSGFSDSYDLGASEAATT